MSADSFEFSIKINSFFAFIKVTYIGTRGYPIKFALGYLAGAYLRFYLLVFKSDRPDECIFHENLHLQVLCKTQLRRKWFESNNDVMVVADDFLGVLTLIFFVEGIAKLDYRWLTCIDVKGDYAEN